MSRFPLSIARAAMNKSAQRRLFVLLIALGTTVGAILYPVEEPNYLPSSRSVFGAKPTEESALPFVVSDLDERVDVDPFSPRGWAPSVPQSAAPAVSEATVAPGVVSPEVPAGPPPLPFQFVGRMNDAGNEVIYLRQGDQMILARSGDTLQGSYKVLSMSATQIELLHVATGEKQFMSIPAPDS
jgi:hypothetical protein